MLRLLIVLSLVLWGCMDLSEKKDTGSEYLTGMEADADTDADADANADLYVLADMAVCTTVCYPDLDGDGYGNGNWPVEVVGDCCPTGYADNGDDWCDDNPEEYTYEGCHADTGDPEDTGDTGDCDTGVPELDCADDLGEDLPWICVDGNQVALKYQSSASYWEGAHSSWDEVPPDATDVVVTGTGVNSSWGYSTSNLVWYDSTFGWMYYEFPMGLYRVTWRGADEWFLYNSWCASSTYASSLCHQNADMSYAICFYSSGSAISILSPGDCNDL